MKILDNRYLYDEDTIDYQMFEDIMNLLIMKTHIQNLFATRQKYRGFTKYLQIFIIVLQGDK